jgi:hypothetical protein
MRHIVNAIIDSRRASGNRRESGDNNQHRHTSARQIAAAILGGSNVEFDDFAAALQLLTNVNP